MIEEFIRFYNWLVFQSPSFFDKPRSSKEVRKRYEVFKYNTSLGQVSSGEITYCSCKKPCKCVHLYIADKVQKILGEER